MYPQICFQPHLNVLEPLSSCCTPLSQGHREDGALSPVVSDFYEQTLRSHEQLSIPSDGAGETVGPPVVCRLARLSGKCAHFCGVRSPAHALNDRSEKVPEDGVCARRRQGTLQSPLVTGQLTRVCIPTAGGWEALQPGPFAQSLCAQGAPAARARRAGAERVCKPLNLRTDRPETGPKDGAASPHMPARMCVCVWWFKFF